MKKKNEKLDEIKNIKMTLSQLQTEDKKEELDGYNPCHDCVDGVGCGYYTG